ncbi:MAG: hypothetical protein ACE5FY_04560 [Nitrospiria bacterium]
MNPFDPFTDPEEMKALFQAHLPAFSKTSLLITECKIERSRVRNELIVPEKRIDCFAIRYQLTVRKKGQTQESVQMLYAKVYPEDFADKIFQQMKSTLLTKLKSDALPDYLSKQKMLVWTFPNDPGLSHLSALIHPDKVIMHFPYSHLPDGLNGPEDVKNINVDVIRYHPGVRCTMRYSLTWEASKTPKTVILYGKTFLEEEGLSLFNLTRDLWEISIKKTEFFIIAKPLVYDAPLKMVWQEGLAGKPLTELIQLSHNMDDIKTVAKNLACLHKSRLSPETPHTTRDRLPVIQKKISKLIAVFPSLKCQLKELSLQLENDFACLPQMKERPAHGAFRIKEIMACQGRLAVFDLDNIAIGDSVRDLALFLADLHAEYHDQRLLYTMASTFYQTYRSEVDWTFPFERLQWHIRVQFIKRAFWIYKHKGQFPHLEERVNKTLSLALQNDPFRLQDC